ncbi:PAS domain-containing protein [Roseomonas stagni]|uniref:histidine kinase n=1 Tax=Falsiroseomonas algicola TaxID=2716930 RepID=A0A6M1LKT6_9PROT|nr:PAS domain-containing protein [Falsiroseomonas algicola]NGM20893.1 PAS domain-containing protein [Falsiroseomonas algicola]
MQSAVVGPGRPARPIWAHLAVLVLSVVVPLWCLLGFVGWAALRAERRDNQQQTILVARNLALELDRALGGFGASLRALATSPAITDGDLRRFQEQASQIVPDGSVIVMRDRTGQHLINTLFPFGTPLPVTVAPEVLAADECVFRTQAICVSNLYTGTVDPQPYVLLDAPVILEGQVAFALSVAVRAAHLATLLADHRLPAGWGVSILDRTDRIVARWPDHERFVGSPANAALREATSAAAEGTVRSVNVAGVPVWGAYVRLPGWGWRVAIGVPEAVLDAPIRRSGIFLAAGGLLAVLASLAAAVLQGRRLAQPIRALGRAATEPGSTPGPSSIRELDQVGVSLAEGAERLRLAQEAGRIGIWELVPDTGQAVVSASQVQLYGLPATAAPHGFGWDAWLRHVHPADRARVAAAMRAAIESGSGYEDHFRIRRADTGEERSIRAHGRMVATAGSAGESRFVGVNIDVTEARAAAEALAASAAEFRAIFENSVIGKVLADAATSRIIRANRGFCQIVGQEEVALAEGPTILDLIHPEDRAANAAGLREAMAEGRPYRVETRLLHRDGGLRWVIMSVALLPGVAGQPARCVAAVQDITDRRRAEERQALLAREVDHRAKNALAVVQAALRLTPRGDAATFARSIEGRVNALARAQTLLAEGSWSGTSLRLLIEGELAGFIGPAGSAGQPRVTLDGPLLQIAAEASQPLAMALHELATNATKHGALSVPGGLVSVSWSVDPSAGTFLLDWVETGASPLPGPPARLGFGSRLLQATLHQLGGTILTEWRQDGLACRLRAPLSRLVADWPAGTPARLPAALE